MTHTFQKQSLFFSLSSSTGGVGVGLQLYYKFVYFFTQAKHYALSYFLTCVTKYTKPLQANKHKGFRSIKHIVNYRTTRKQPFLANFKGLRQSYSYICQKIFCGKFSTQHKNRLPEHFIKIKNHLPCKGWLSFVVGEANFYGAAFFYAKKREPG